MKWLSFISCLAVIFTGCSVLSYKDREKEVFYVTPKKKISPESKVQESENVQEGQIF